MARWAPRGDRRPGSDPPPISRLAGGKVSLRTNINNKLSFNISGNINANCKNNENTLNKIEISKSKTFSISHKSDSVCNLDSTNIIFTANYSDIKVNKILNQEVMIKFLSILNLN